MARIELSAAEKGKVGACSWRCVVFLLESATQFACPRRKRKVAVAVAAAAPN